MVRTPCCLRIKGEKKGPWTPEEDLRLTKYIEIHGEGQWRTLPQKAGLDRCGKGCRLRWMNYLRPNVKRGNISLEEEELIIRLHKLLGNRWSLIAGRVPGRTDNEIKNYWNTHLSKRFKKERKPNSDQYSAKPKNPISTSSLEKQKENSEAQYFQVAETVNEAETRTTCVSEFELHYHNCYYNLINPSLENHGEIWSNLDPTVEAWNGDNIDGSWAQLGFVDMSSSPCLLELSNSMQPPALSSFDYDGFGGGGYDSGVQNQHVDNINNSAFDLCPLPQSCFSDFMDQEQQGLASIGDFATIHAQQETFTGQIELTVDHYDGLDTWEISSWMGSCEADLICNRHCWL